MATQDDKAAAWLGQHGIAAKPPRTDTEAALADAQADGQDDWASEAERWYEQRAQGVDVAQLLQYHQTAAK